MKTSSLFLILLFITLSINSIKNESSNSSIKCGKVFDGLTNGAIDMDVQTSTSTIAANWVGFGNEVLFFEWAIVSDSYRIPLTSSMTSEGCYEDLRIIRPDVMQWEKLEKHSSSAIKSNLSLSEGRKYFVLLRVTYRTGLQLIAISNGVTVITPLDDDQLFDTSSSGEVHSKMEIRNLDGKRIEIHNRNKRNFIQTSTATVTTSENCIASDFSSTCPIDNANRCRQDTHKRVSDYLNQIYGKAVFPQITEQPTIILVEHFDDDDDGDYYWILAPIIGFIFGLFLLALCLVCIVFVCCNMGRRKELRDDNPDYGDIEDNLDGKDYGNRGGVNKADTATATKVEFPDTNIRRLSVDHNDEEEVTEEVKGTRRKHPIASSASSSFRDYRSVNQ